MLPTVTTGVFRVTEAGNGTLYYVMYDEDSNPSETVPPLRMALTNGMSFKMFSDNGLVGHMVFIDQRVSGEWNVVLLVSGRSVPMTIQKIDDTPKMKGGYQTG